MCYPLTITDDSSRFLLRCQALQSTCRIDAKDWMEHTFREYGLPDAIRSDNGSPFASIAAGGISRLSKWWIQLGIRPQRIKPGHPQQNGRHERIQVRKVKRSGEIKWRNTHIYISQVLSGDYISLEEIDNDVWEIRYGFYKLGILRGKDMKLERATQWHKKSC